jgi:hypothetical protein
MRRLDAGPVDRADGGLHEAFRGVRSDADFWCTQAQADLFIVGSAEAAADAGFVLPKGVAEVLSPLPEFLSL